MAQKTIFRSKERGEQDSKVTPKDFGLCLGCTQRKVTHVQVHYERLGICVYIKAVLVKVLT